MNNKKLKTQIKPGSEKSASSTLLQPIEYQKINMEALDSSLLETGSYDDKPMIFIGKDEELISKQFLKNPRQVQQIIKSFHNFRDIIESMGHDQMDNDAFW